MWENSFGIQKKKMKIFDPKNNSSSSIEQANLF
jgi:hypothetical protein